MIQPINIYIYLDYIYSLNGNGAKELAGFTKNMKPNQIMKQNTFSPSLME